MFHWCPTHHASLTTLRTSSAYESALLARLAAASLLSSALSRKQLVTHKNSGLERRDQDCVQLLDYVRLLHAFVFSNAAAASIQLCSAIIVSSLSLAGRSPSTQLRQGIFMVSFRLSLLQDLICTRSALLHSCYVTFLSILLVFGVDSLSQ
jgi:hypothetical protein